MTTASRQQSKLLYASHTMIEFIEETHTYLVDGVITPSVTTLIHDIWIPSMYKGINADTLKRAASYGTKVHEMIEKWNKGEETDVDRKSFEGLALRRYQSLAEEHVIRAEMQEIPVAYVRDGKALYAGKFDFYGTVDGKKTLMDYKTTSKYYPKYLSLQLTLYKMALEQTYDVKVESLACMFLPKKSYGNLFEVDELNGEQLIKDIITYGTKHNAEV